MVRTIAILVDHSRNFMQRIVPYCTRSAHGALQHIDFIAMSIQSIMGATANSFPLAAGNLAAVFSIMLEWALAPRDSKSQLENACTSE